MREHVHTLRIHYGLTDQMGLVYHANYLHFFEVGRTELLRAAGAAYADMEREGYRLVVTEASCRYRSGARYDEEITVVTRVEEVRPASIRFRYAVRGADGRAVAEGATSLACVSPELRPRRLPAHVTGLLTG